MKNSDCTKRKTGLTITSYLKKKLARYSISDYGLFFLYSLLLMPFFDGVVRAIEVRLGLSSVEDLLGIVWPVIAALLGVPNLFRHFQWKNLFFLLLIVAVYCFSPLVYPNSRQDVEDGAVCFLFNCLPFYFVGMSIDTDKYKNVFLLMAKIAILVLLLYEFVFVVNRGETFGDEETGEAMGLAYLFLPWTLIALWQCFEEFTVVNVLFAAIAVFLLLSLGTRGPLVCLVFFASFYFIAFKKYRRDIAVKSIILVCSVTLYVFSDNIVLFFLGVNVLLGLSTRVFDNYLNEGMISLQNSSGRDGIYASVITAIQNDNTYIGYGLFSDRHFVGPHAYCHNLELEILCDFGVVAGTLILIILSLFVIKTFRKSWDKPSIMLVLVFFCSSIVMHQFSGSCLLNFQLWLFLGVCASVSNSSYNYYPYDSLYRYRKNRLMYGRYRIVERQKCGKTETEQNTDAKDFSICKRCERQKEIIDNQ